MAKGNGPRAAFRAGATKSLAETSEAHGAQKYVRPSVSGPQWLRQADQGAPSDTKRVSPGQRAHKSK